MDKKELIELLNDPRPEEHMYTEQQINNMFIPNYTPKQLKQMERDSGVDFVNILIKVGQAGAEINKEEFGRMLSRMEE